MEKRLTLYTWERRKVEKKKTGDQYFQPIFHRLYTFSLPDFTESQSLYAFHTNFDYFLSLNCDYFLLFLIFYDS